MGKESRLPESSYPQCGWWAMPQQRCLDSFTGAGSQLREASGSLRMGELGPLCIQTHPSLPSIHVSSLVSQEKKAKERQVQRFLYTLWSSKKQPDVQSLVELLVAVRRCTPHRRRAGPLLLHCRYPGVHLHLWAASRAGSHPAAQLLGMVPTSLPLHALGACYIGSWEPVEVLSPGGSQGAVLCRGLAEDRANGAGPGAWVELAFPG